MFMYSPFWFATYTRYAANQNCETVSRFHPHYLTGSSNVDLFKFKCLQSTHTHTGARCVAIICRYLFIFFFQISTWWQGVCWYQDASMGHNQLWQYLVTRVSPSNYLDQIRCIIDWKYGVKPQYDVNIHTCMDTFKRVTIDAREWHFR